MSHLSPPSPTTYVSYKLRKPFHFIFHLFSSIFFLLCTITVPPLPSSWHWTVSLIKAKIESCSSFHSRRSLSSLSPFVVTRSSCCWKRQTTWQLQPLALRQPLKCMVRHFKWGKSSRLQHPSPEAIAALWYIWNTIAVMEAQIVRSCAAKGKLSCVRSCLSHRIWNARPGRSAARQREKETTKRIIGGGQKKDRTR